MTYLICCLMCMLAVVFLLWFLLKSLTEMQEDILTAFKFIKYNTTDIDHIQKYLGITPVRKIEAVNDEEIK